MEGINNHQMTNIPIGQFGGVTDTNKGPAILIMSQYAYSGKGTTIHSSPQMEAAGHEVDEKSAKVGGRQLIKTTDGYVIPLNIKNGLARLKLRPYDDNEWDQLPHIFLTSQNEWDPTSLDNDMADTEEWHDAVQDLEAPRNDHFDEKGDYRHRVVDMAAIEANDDDDDDDDDRPPPETP